METLYDLLGALPNDDADDLRAAFRRAVKRAHPDVNPEDPDAGLKFRRIVRANEFSAMPGSVRLMIICWKSHNLSRRERQSSLLLMPRSERLMIPWRSSRSRWQSTLSPTRSTSSLPV